jgi:hypothetical protein
VRLGAGDDTKMASHTAKILSAIELWSRVTLELQPEARNLTVNNFLMKDAAELTNLLQGHPAALAELEDWYTRRMKDVTPVADAVEAKETFLDRWSNPAADYRSGRALPGLCS